jgi:hypothetical protein
MGARASPYRLVSWAISTRGADLPGDREPSLARVYLRRDALFCFEERVFVLPALFFFALVFAFFLGKVTLAETIVPRQFAAPHRHLYSFSSAFVVFGVRS